MKKSLILSILSLSLLLGACGGSSGGGDGPSPEPGPTPTPEPVPEDPDSYVDKLPDATKVGVILHAFGWKFKQIESQLPYIAEAGFKSVQTLPVQTPKSNGSAWWAYYQPLSFSIAESTPLGTKDDLISLCTEAEKYSISIIVDVVFNHMANIADGQYEADGTPKVYPGVENYEPYIYQHRNDASNPTFHHNKNATGSGAETQFYQYGDLPDLNTGNTYVQNRCYEFLKECIDAGVDGFRFDAAKHIETPDDPDYPSDFWTNTLGKAKDYYKKQTNKELYAYAETLGNPLKRSIEVYTKIMNVLDDGYGPSVANTVGQRSAENTIKLNYGKSTDASNMVGYVESHDTFTSEKSHLPEKWVSLSWAVLASRKDYKSLYFARTDDAFNIGQIYDYTFKNDTVGAVNRFHNRFVGAEEYLSASGSIFVNERVGNDSKGAVVIDFKQSKDIEVDLPHLGTAVYYDQITGQSVTVRDGKASFSPHSSGIAVLTKTKNLPLPTIEVSERDTAFVDNKDITIKTTNGTKSTYQINNGEKVEFNKKVTVSLDKSMAIDNQIDLTVEVTNGQITVKETFHYTIVKLIPGYFNVLGIDPSVFTDFDVYLWSWTSTSSSYNQNYGIQDGILLTDTSGLEGFLVVAFEKGHVIPNLHEWDDACVKKSVDIKGSILEQGYIVLDTF